MKNSINFNSMIAFMQNHYPGFNHLNIHEFMDTGGYQFINCIDRSVLVIPTSKGFTVYEETDDGNKKTVWKLKGGVYSHV